MHNVQKAISLPFVLAMLSAGCGNQSIHESSAVSTASVDPSFCAANASWVQKPQGAPAEVPGNGADLCQFYQFSWQWFIALMDAPNGTQRVFLDSQKYPVFLGEGQNSCADNNTESKLFVRSLKDNTVDSNDFVAPNEMNQAFNNAVIYDQQGNIVLYEARIDRGMCAVPKGSPTLPAGTTEIKSSWRTIEKADKPNYVWIQSDTNNNGTLESDELYGMVGFHLVKSTPLHPEFIWATFEHKLNAPDCQKKPISGQADHWTFTSESCAKQLPNPPATSTCHFNKVLEPASGGSSPLTGEATEICQVYAQGTRPGDNQADKNRENIITINTQLSAIFSGLNDSNALKVLKNYKIVGALWENDVSQPSSVLANQRGSIQLANTTMETNAQQGFSDPEYTGTNNLKPAANCFACHNYTGRSTNAGVSHIFKYIHGK